MIAIQRYERAGRPAGAEWHGRPVFNLHDAQGHWIGRAAAETPEEAEEHARRYACAAAMEETLRSISLSPEAAMALYQTDHQLWSQIITLLRFLDHGPEEKSQ